MAKLKKLKLPVIPVYPLLLGLYPVLYLWNANRVQEPAYVVLPSLLVSLIGLLVIYGVFLAILRDIHRAALPAAVLSFYLVSYGQFDHLVKGWAQGKIQPYLLPVTALLVLALVIFLAVRKVGGPNLTKLLNLITAALITYQVASATPYYLSMAQLRKASAHPETVQTKIPLTSQPERDVYFILLDNYGRQDILQSAANFDNSALINALKERGFVFPDCAQGNYFWTVPAMTSILNMNYLDNMGVSEKVYTQRTAYDAMAPLIQDSEVIRKFRSYGYHVVTFRGFMGMLDIQNTDTYVSFEKETDYVQRLETNKFKDLYLQTTIFSPINDQFKIYPDWIEKNGPDFLKKTIPPKPVLEPQFQQVYDQNLYAFDALTRIPKEVQSPKFVYAHIYTTHWPFMMRPDGSLRLPFTQQMTTEGYIDAVKYTNSRVLSAIDSILAHSKVKPVIILQGDHSDVMVDPVEWSGTDRVKILSGYYLPDGGDQLLYKNISPVNNFRLVFNKYFGEDIPLLMDINYYLDTQTKKVTKAPETCISNSAGASTK